MTTLKFHRPFHKTWLVGLALFAVALSSCVYDKEFAYLNDQIFALNRRVTSLEEKLNQDLDKRLGPMRTNQAETRVEIDRMREAMMKLSARVEDNDRVIKRAVERDLGDQDSVKGGLNQISLRVAELEKTVKQHHDYLRLEAPAPAQGETAPEKAGPPVPPPATGERPKATEGDLYDSSLALYREGKYENAIDGFKDFLKKYPNSDRADNAQFWIGESYMALRQWEQAVLAYQAVIKKYPKGNKVAGAYLKQGMAFLELKDKQAARVVLDKVVKNYPSSSEATVAKKKLEALR